MAIALSNGLIIDCRSQAFVGHVVADGERIVAVGPGEPPPGPGRIDLGGGAVLPGLIDTHVHLCLDGGVSPAAQVTSETYAMTLLRAARNARRQIESGFTTVRDLGARSCLDAYGAGGIAYNLKHAIADGICAGPRILASGLAITVTGGHSHWMGREADGADAVRKAVRLELKEGADVVKFMATGGIATPDVRRPVRRPAHARRVDRGRERGAEGRAPNRGPRRGTGRHPQRDPRRRGFHRAWLVPHGAGGGADEAPGDGLRPHLRGARAALP